MLIRRKLQNGHGCRPKSCRHQLWWNSQHTPVNCPFKHRSASRFHLSLSDTHKTISPLRFFLAMLTEPRTSSATPSSTRIPTTSWCVTWRTKWLVWRSCSVPRALETSWIVSLTPWLHVHICSRAAATFSLWGSTISPFLSAIPLCRHLRPFT